MWRKSGPAGRIRTCNPPVNSRATHAKPAFGAGFSNPANPILTRQPNADHVTTFSFAPEGSPAFLEDAAEGWTGQVEGFPLSEQILEMEVVHVGVLPSGQVNDALA